MMRVLVPVKTPTQAKQRLASLLGLDERRQLARAMAIDLLTLLAGHPGIGPVTVCGNDESTEDLAAEARVEYLPESELNAVGLSPVVNAAAARYAAAGESELLVIHGDVPLLSHPELERFLATHRAAGARAVTIAPDRWHGGTNLMAWRPITTMSVQYGVGSFDLHCAAARASGAELTICELQGAAIDVDEPADVQAVIYSTASSLAPRTRDFLRSARLLERLNALPKRTA
jgi:2-phospho-L-lactate guanylyltransferase